MLFSIVLEAIQLTAHYVYLDLCYHVTTEQCVKPWNLQTQWQNNYHISWNRWKPSLNLSLVIGVCLTAPRTQPHHHRDRRVEGRIYTPSALWPQLPPSPDATVCQRPNQCQPDAVVETPLEQPKSQAVPDCGSARGAGRTGMGGGCHIGGGKWVTVWRCSGWELGSRLWQCLKGLEDQEWGMKDLWSLVLCVA